MCGRAYETYTDEELYFRYSSKRTTLQPRSAVYNLCPTMNSPVLRVVSGLRKFDEMRWQLVPSTEPAFTTKFLNDKCQERRHLPEPAVSGSRHPATLHYSSQRFFRMEERRPMEAPVQDPSPGRRHHERRGNMGYVAARNSGRTIILLHPDDGGE